MYQLHIQSHCILLYNNCSFINNIHSFFIHQTRIITILMFIQYMDLNSSIVFVLVVERSEAVGKIMFEAAVGRFVKAVGRESLHPVPSLDQANQCRPMQVVVKRSKYWAWQTAHYEATPFSLDHLLQGDDSLEQSVNLFCLAPITKMFLLSFM